MREGPLNLRRWIRESAGTQSFRMLQAGSDITGTIFQCNSDPISVTGDFDSRI